MADENRVLSRVGARELSPEEVDRVGGAFRTIYITGDPSGPSDFAGD
jgi:hypothetical protein